MGLAIHFNRVKSSKPHSFLFHCANVEWWPSTALVLGKRNETCEIGRKCEGREIQRSYIQVITASSHRRSRLLPKNQTRTSPPGTSKNFSTKKLARTSLNKNSALPPARIKKEPFSQILSRTTPQD